MQDIFGSVRRSLVFRPNPGGDDDGSGRGGGSGRFVEKIGTCLRKSRVGLGLGLGFLPKLQSPLLPPPTSPPARDVSPAIRWRKGELIGCGAFGHVYMGMNLDSGELLAVKQVLIGTNNASKEKAQAHIRELEEEVKLLKNLSHPNIVRYLGTVREENTLNILLEFVSGGSISSLLGKFGSFPEAVIRMYSKQLLQGLQYLHQNGIMHRDIKGANILVDNKGCIKLADFGASKQVAKLATMTAAKSMKGTPYWMAPEVILQTGHSFSADIWSVGCTIIEMATGKPPWSQQFQEVAALFHIGTTKSHPPIPEHLSSEAKDFLLKCLQKEPSTRSTASELLQHPFVTGEVQGVHPLYCPPALGHSFDIFKESKLCLKNSLNPEMGSSAKQGFEIPDEFGKESTEKLFYAKPLWERCSSDDMCQLGDKDDSQLVGSSFNPMSEPFDDWPCKFDLSPEQRNDDSLVFKEMVKGEDASASTSCNMGNNFSFPHGPFYEEDDEVTETKIRAFLDEKALDLKKLQTPLYEEFYNTVNASSSSNVACDASEGNTSSNLKLSPRSKLSPSKGASSQPAVPVDSTPSTAISPRNCSNRRMSGICGENVRILREIPSPKLNELGGLIEDSEKEDSSPSASFSERRRKWKEELDRELEREREMMRQAGAIGGRTASPKERLERSVSQRRDRLHFASPSK